MEWCNLGIDGLTFAGLSVLHITFVSRLSGKKPKLWQFFEYFFLLCFLQWFCVCFHIEGAFAIGLELLVLWGMSRFAMGSRWPVCGVVSILGVYISQLSFGMVNSAEAVVFPLVTGNRFWYMIVILATLAAFALCEGCYRLVLRFLSFQEGQFVPNIWILLLSGLFFFSAELYIIETAYGYMFQGGEVGEQFVLLCLQVLGLGTLLCTLYSYKHICQGLQTQAMVASLKQANHAQKVYVGEAGRRYEKTKAFRHDIKNHFAVLNGLLHAGKTEEAKQYLEKMETASLLLSFSYQTGNPVVDILLGEKLELAKEKKIVSSVALSLPQTWGMDEFDLCVIVANALDNAIEACEKVEGERWIHIKGECQGDLYMLEVKNACIPGPLPSMGTGLSNIKAAAEKYYGTMLMEKEEGCFCLNVLLQMV